MDHEDGQKIVTIAATAKRKQKTQPRSILTEEEYTDTLTHIVTRDYFPSIPSLKRDNAILEARSRGDVAAAVAVRRTARKEETDREREWQENLQEEDEAAIGTTALTHWRNGSGSISIRKRPRPLKHETVTGFHARVTSEDNAEFEMNQEREQRELEAKLDVVYSAAANKTGRLMIESTLNNQGVEDSSDDIMYSRRSLSPGLASDKFNATPSGIRITDGRNNFKGNIHGITKNGLFFEPPQHRNQDATASKSDNLLMPPPPTRVPNPTGSTVPSQQSKDQPPTKDENAYSSSSKHLYELVEYIPKSTEPNINPPATRFPYQNESRLLPNNSHNKSDIRRSNWHMSDTSASESTDLDASPRSLARERAAYQKTKNRENETFVAMTPLIRPGGSGVRSKGETCVEEEPIMTWGNVASTPQVLGGGSSADGYNNSVEWEPSPLLAIDVGDPDMAVQPTFDMVEKSRREAMAQKAEKILMERAKKYRAAGSSETKKRAEYSSKSKSNPGNPLDRSASLTPAARALLQASNRNPSSGLSLFQSSSTTTSTNGSRRSNARSKDSFGSALRMAYTPTPETRVRAGSKRRNSSTSAMLRSAAAGATPRID
ncbi:hypothetical protein ACHAXM_010581 [Skeletonema potamos]